MREERTIWIDGIGYPVIVSDEKEALLAAHAAGRAIIGLWSGEEGQDLSPARYLVESAGELDETYLERVVRRTLGLPWTIGQTKRLLIREFEIKDCGAVRPEPEDQEPDRIFSKPDLLSRYIRCQYGFYEYGIWALVERESGKLVGKAGVTDLEIDWDEWELTEEEKTLREERTLQEEQTLQKEQMLWEEPRKQEEPTRQETMEQVRELELGYHIFSPYRGKGYATEACREILRYMKQQFPCRVCAKIDASNEASIYVARNCGLKLTGRRYNESGQWQYLYAECWK